MRAPLDTHGAAWYVQNDPKLTATARAILANPSNEILVSPASYWETAIKVHSGKWNLPMPYSVLVNALFGPCGFHILPILPVHTLRLIGMPNHHNDPFDRLIIAQALVEQVPVISADTKFDAYGVTRIWA